MNIRNPNDIKSLFFDNLTTKQTLFKNTFWISLSATIGKILRAILIIYTARILGATDYGRFAFALAFVSLFVTFFDFGLSSIITREFSQERKKDKEFLSLLSLKVILGLLSTVLIFFASFLITSDPEIRKIILILAVFTFASQFPEIFSAFFRARQRMEYESWANIIQTLLVAGFGFFVIFNFPSVKNISYSYLFSSFIALIPLLFFFHFKIFPLKFSLNLNIWKRFLALSWPLALTSILGMVYGYFDSVIMGHWNLIIQTGWYNAALRIINIIQVPVDIISLTFYPVMSKFAKESKILLQKVWDCQIEIMIFLAIPITVGGMVLAPGIIDFIYGSDFSSSVLAFQILIPMAGITFFSIPFNRLLIATDQQDKTFWVAFWAVVVNLILNLILIPKFSLYGAAIAILVTNVLIFLLSLRFVFKFTSIQPLNFKFFSALIIAALSSLAMYSIISQPKIYSLNIFFSVIIGALVYLISLFILQKTIKPIFLSYEKA